MPDFLLFIIVLGSLIIGHELGHFIAAKLCGIKVDEFGIGYPPRIATLFRAGGTKFTLNWIPLGGFVLPAGEDDPDVPGGLAASSKRIRATVILAGPIANIFLAFIAFMMAFKFAAPDSARVLITHVVEDAPAQLAGIQPGDIVLSVGDEQITSIQSIIDVIDARVGTLAQIVLDRDGQQIIVEVVPRTQHPADQGPIGVILGNPAKPTSWFEASKHGLDSIITQVDAFIRLPIRLLRGNTSPDETRISGLKGIHDMLAWANSIDRSAQRPFLTLNLIGAISTCLALANLLPFPPLDGGRLMFVIFETIFKRRLKPRHEGLALAIGFSLLLMLMIYINIQDFVKPIVLP